MYVIKGMRQCSCYELDDKEGRLLVDLELPGGKREEFTVEMEKVNFFIPVRALSG
jgi:HSP20 family molecular chaperone IbpA